MSDLEDFAVAIERIDSNYIKTSISNRRVDVNARLPRDNNPPALVHASSVKDERANIVKLLLNAGARIDDVDSSGRSACHVAAMCSNNEVMRRLVAHRPNLALRDMNGDTALQIASRILSFRSDSIVLLLIQAGASLDDIMMDKGQSACLCRLAATTTLALQLLIDRGVVVRDLRDQFGRTSLALATRMNADFAVLSKLVDCGVALDIETPSLHAQSCSYIAIMEGNEAALRLFLLAGADVNDLLRAAVAFDKFECLMLLLAAGADVTARDRRGRTACHLTVNSAEKMPKMRFLHAMLAFDASLDDEDGDGCTPRQFLAERGMTVDPEQVDFMRGEIAKVRLDFVRNRAMEVCIGLQSLRLDALQLCEVLQHACGPLARFTAFHQWWKIATTVKHFTSRSRAQQLDKD
jgi:ankyrin repeat protein